ncbi:MAG: outer membrane beta-barrel domain-containing protein [Desulfobacterales bacterium]|nr:outer membrane beta-barrel domain-containing protein [Desulfobacterales bacterium]
MKKIFLMVPVLKTAMVLFALVLLLPLSARSEIRAGSFEVSPFAGYNFFESHQNLEDDFVFGGRLGYNFTRNLGIELVGEYLETKVDDNAEPWTKPGQFTSPIDDVDITFYHLDLLYHLIPDGSFNPFVAVGYGFANYDPKINDHDMAFVSFGLGAKYWLTDNFGLRLDLRDHLIFDETIHNVAATFGVVFAFGGKKKPAPAAVAKYEPTPEPKAAEKVIVLVPMAEPEVEETVKFIAAEPPVKEKIVILAFEDVHFDFDKSTLTKKAQASLKRSIQILKDNPKAKIRIGGYTSAKGTKEYNQKLSERRAKAVYDYLVNEGLVPAEKLTTIGYGQTRPAMYEPIPENMYSKEAKANMRVLFEVIVQ